MLSTLSSGCVCTGVTGECLVSKCKTLPILTIDVTIVTYTLVVFREHRPESAYLKLLNETKCWLLLLPTRGNTMCDTSRNMFSLLFEITSFGRIANRSIVGAHLAGGLADASCSGSPSRWSPSFRLCPDPSSSIPPVWVCWDRPGNCSYDLFSASRWSYVTSDLAATKTKLRSNYLPNTLYNNNSRILKTEALKYFRALYNYIIQSVDIISLILQGRSLVNMWAKNLSLQNKYSTE